ncbi:hypothetical protein DHEL01_v210870 [Diaporthe helianthi]|uniref:Uncharacterized protein n=1 Tax=Diaporthe helianthi TaxID=158607 RepID=A0A2P5HKI1_DIAHE|nr:hypothetical protein DHEL01_v210870 [Diaporthe helianthi]
MSRFKFLACLMSLGATAVVQAQDVTQPWALGTPVTIMAISKDVVDDSTRCPAKLSDARAVPWDYTPVQANVELGIVVASNPNPDGKLIEKFYLTNGLSVGQPLAEAGTRIRVPGENLCWFREASSGNVRLGRCGPEYADQAFYASLPAEGQTTPASISTTDSGGNSLAVMYEFASTGNTPVIFGDGTPIVYCFYHADTGVLLTAPADPAAAYTAKVSYTNVTASSFSAGAPRSESEAPQCNWAAWGDDGPNGTAANIQQSSSSPDCLLARTAASDPADECLSDPSNGDCILHVAVAFCADLPEVLQDLTVAEKNGAVETCLRRASQGPCVANPSGAACASGLYAGIKFVGGGDGGGGASSKRQQIDLETLFFGDPNNPDSELPFVSQFFVGIAKNLINSAASALNMLATPFVEELRWKCQEASLWTHLFSNDTGTQVRRGCTKVFSAWDNSTVLELEMKTPFEQAGSVFADVAMLLSAVGDLAEAAKAVSAVDWVMTKFGLRAAQLGKDEGLVLEAVQGENTVQLFRNAGDGSPALIGTEAEGEALAREVDSSAFRNCVECVEAGLVKRDGEGREEGHSSKLQARAPVKKRLCCSLGLNLKLDVPPPVQDPLSMRTLDAVTGDQASDVLKSLSTSFSTWYKDGKDVFGVDAGVDETSQLLLSTTKTITSKRPEMIGALEKLYGIDTRESYALKNWFGARQASRMLPGLDEAMAKLPYASGTAIRSTNLDEATLKMLDEGAAGIISKGEKGVYEVRDLVINYGPTFPSVPERKIMAATMELDDSAALTFKARYFFVINSKSGRLTAPFSGEWLREVDFVQGSSGKFRLIGKQELNGGAKAAAEPGREGPFAVYYFDEVEVPAAPASFTKDQVMQALTDANVRWEGNP